MTEISHPWPRHVAVIMDGNGRWARQRRLPRIEGHKAGIKSVQAVVESCRKLDISCLTLYTFSVENWQRPRGEINELMRLLYYYLSEEIPRLQRNAVCLRVIGQMDRLPQRVQRRLRQIMEKTVSHRKLTLVLALSYGGRTEILDAVRDIARRRKKSASEVEPLTPEAFARHLYAPDLPYPDLLVRTSGEMRLSNFLLWEAARARLVFTAELWPDFREKQFERVIDDVRKARTAAAGGKE